MSKHVGWAVVIGLYLACFVVSFDNQVCKPMDYPLQHLEVCGSEEDWERTNLEVADMLRQLREQQPKKPSWEA